METGKNHLATLASMLLIAVGVVWVLYPEAFFSNFHLLYDDIAFSFLNTVVLGYGLGLIESRIKISWIKTPFKRLMVTIIAYLLFVFIMSNLIFIVEYVIVLNRVQLPKDFFTYISISKIPLLVALIIGGFFTSMAFLENWRKNIIELERLEKEKVKAQYDALKNQVNPHFLFNSLNALSSLIYEDRDVAVKFIKKLSNVYRYVLDVKDQEVVPLSQELEFVDSYFFLQKIRFGENILLIKKLDGEHKSKLVPPLSLQLLIENAFKHNEASEEKPLTIEINELENYIQVVNNLNPKANVETSGVGLENLKLRYSRLTDKHVSVDIDQTQFSVKIPLLTQWNQ